MGEQSSLAGAVGDNGKEKKPKKSTCKYNKWQAASALYKSCRISDYEEASYWADYLTERLGQSEYYVATVLAKLVSEDGCPEEWASVFSAVSNLPSLADKIHLRNSIKQAIWSICNMKKWYMTSEGREKAAIDEAIEQEVKRDARTLPGYAVDGIHCKGKVIDQSITGTWAGWHSILKLWNDFLERHKGLEEKELIKLWSRSHKKRTGGEEDESKETEKSGGEEENGN